MKKKKSISYEPIRHEWISLRLFLSFITKSNNNYNSTQPVEYITKDKILSIDEGYFKENNIDKNIK